MASIISPLLRRSLHKPTQSSLSTTLTLGLGVTGATCFYLLSRPRRLLLCESAVGSSGRSTATTSNTASSSSSSSYFNLNPRTIRQISTGSILGMLGGFTVSLFSKPLAVLFGLFVVGWQYLANRGIDIIPRSMVERLVRKGTEDVRKLVNDDAPLKMSFGITFALAAAGRF